MSFDLAEASDPIEVRAQLPKEVLEAIAQHAANLVVERLAGERNGHESEYLTVAEAADLLRAKPQRVYDLLSDGRLTRHKDGSRVLVARAELVAHLLPSEGSFRGLVIWQVVSGLRSPRGRFRGLRGLPLGTAAIPNSSL